jgi:hypothetical protein
LCESETLRKTYTGLILHFDGGIHERVPHPFREIRIDSGEIEQGDAMVHVSLAGERFREELVLGARKYEPVFFEGRRNQ